MRTRFARDIYASELQEDLVKLRTPTVTPGEFFLNSCDGKFTDDALTDEGNAFAQEYFDFNTGSYLKDYERILVKKLPSQYHVQDTWTNFDTLRPVLDRRLAEWRRRRSSSSRSWWRFW